MDLRKDEDRAALADEFGPMETEPLSTQDSELSTYSVDRTGWPKGPWDGEPDKIQWVDESSGLDCLMVRRERFGYWCGYVGVPEGHRCFEVDFNELEFAVHGGLSYSDFCYKHICHVPEDGRPERVWWLGFDCNHAFDFVPKWAEDMKLYQGLARQYKTVEFVKAECAKLAGQLK